MRKKTLWDAKGGCEIEEMVRELGSGRVGA